MKRPSKVGPLFLNHLPIQARGEDRPGHQVEVPLVVLRGNRFPSRHGTATLFALFMPTFAAVLAPLRGSSRTPLSSPWREWRRLCLSLKNGPGGVLTAFPPMTAPSIDRFSMPHLYLYVFGNGFLD